MGASKRPAYNGPMRRVLMSLIAFVASALCHAQGSFDLVLAMDYTTKSIKRYDGATGAYFGEFGAGRLVRPRFMERGPNAGEVVVTDVLDEFNGYSSIVVFDYNTGVVKRQMFTTVFPQLAGITRIGATSEYHVFEVNPSSYGLRRVNLSSMSLVSSAFHTGTTFAFASDLTTVGTDLYLTGSTGQLRRHASPGATPTSVALADPTALTTCTGSFRFRSNVLAPAFGGNNGKIYGANGAVILATSMSSIFGLASGHEYDYVAGYQGSNATIQVYNRGYLVGSFGTGTLQAPSDLLVIMAPEPATLAALGLGMMVLVRRRKR